MTHQRLDSTEQPLADAPLGQPLKVVRVVDASAFTDRVVEMGFTPEARVELLRRAPMGGPLLLRIRNTVLTMRRGDARCVWVRGVQ